MLKKVKVNTNEFSLSQNGKLIFFIAENKKPKIWKQVQFRFKAAT